MRDLLAFFVGTQVEFMVFYKVEVCRLKSKGEVLFLHDFFGDQPPAECEHIPMCEPVSRIKPCHAMRFSINIRKQHDAKTRDTTGSGMLFRFNPASGVQPNDPFLFRHVLIVSAEIGKFRPVEPAAKRFPIAPERGKNHQTPKKDCEITRMHRAEEKRKREKAESEKSEILWRNR